MIIVRWVKDAGHVSLLPGRRTMMLKPSEKAMRGATNKVGVNISGIMRGGISYDGSSDRVKLETDRNTKEETTTHALIRTGLRLPGSERSPRSRPISTRRRGSESRTQLVQSEV